MIFKYEYKFKNKIMNSRINTNIRTTNIINYEMVPLYLCGGMCGLLLFCLLFGLPTSEIVMGLYFREKLVCNTPLFISISEWLVIKGSISVIGIIILFVCFFSAKNSLLYCLILPVVYIINLFLLIWVIVGSILFWRDCPNLEPKEVNTYMWFSLIFGYIFVCNTISVNNSIYEKNEKPKSALLG